MGLQVAGLLVERIDIVDDEPTVRQAYAEQVKDLQLEPVSEAGPLTSLEGFAREAAGRTQGAVCDYQLGARNYASFHGAALVAKWYELGYPALLCTKWEQAVIDEMRRFRARIPVLIKPSELDPDRLLTGLEVCIRELRGERAPSRRVWRTLVRVEDVSRDRNTFAFVVLPAWDNERVVRIPLSDIPEPIRSGVKADLRLYAWVNLGAETNEELFFDRWEVSR